jgi:hypothetical protein
MPGKMARSPASATIRAARCAGSGPHLASVLQQGRKTRILTPVWESSGESRLRYFLAAMLFVRQSLLRMHRSAALLVLALRAPDY